MSVQALISYNPFTLNSVLKGNYKRTHCSSYHDLLVMQNQNFKKQIDHFLKFSQMTSSQNFPTALGILKGKDANRLDDDDYLDYSPEDIKPIRQFFDTEGRVIQFISSDGTLDYKITYDDNITTVTNQLTGEVHLQEMDDQGRLVKDIFPCGLEISWKFDGELLSEVTLPNQSKVVYQYIDESHINIKLLNPNGEVQYQHAYEAENDTLEKEVLIGKAGKVQRHYDETSKTLITESNHLCVIDQYDEDRSLISRTLKDLIEKKTPISLNYPVGNLLAGEKRQLDDQGRVIHYNGFTCSYDEKGRLTQKASSDQTFGYRYDALDRLISVDMGNKKVEYTHDLLGRRFSKTVTENGETNKEFYLYQGANQIAVYNENKELIHQRILGVAFHTHLPFAIAIESQGKTYAPIYSSNYNILQLIDKDSKEAIQYESLSPFGENLQDLNPICPWIFGTKYFDSDTGLIDFGDRQYDPSIKQWTSPDPDPRATEEELYSYCNNNPLKFIDPNGNFVIFIPLTQGLWAAAAAILTGIGAFAAKKGVDHINENQKPRRENKNKSQLDNGVKNPQYSDAVTEVERKLGRKLNDREWRRFHDHVTGQGYGYHEMVDEGFHLFDDRYRHN